MSSSVFFFLFELFELALVGIPSLCWTPDLLRGPEEVVRSSSTSTVGSSKCVLGKAGRAALGFALPLPVEFAKSLG